MTTNPWVVLITGLVTIMNTIVSYLAMRRSEEVTKKVLEGEGLKKANDISGDIATARESLRHDLEELQRDPNNRRKGDTL